MTQLDQIVFVNITKQTQAVTQAGFGIPAVLTYHTRFVERARVFTSADSMLVAAGGPFQSTDMAYQLASKIFSQNPRPPRVIVGRRQHPTIRTVDITPVSVGVIGTLDGLPRANAAYSVKINSSEFTYTTDGTPTVAEITAGLTALINAGTEDVLATDNTTYLTIEKAVTPGGVATAGVSFALEYDKRLLTSKDQTPVAVGGAIADEIAAFRAENDDWYGLVGDWFGSDEILAVFAAIQALSKITSATSQDDDLYSSAATDVASLLLASNYTKAWVNYHQKPHAGISPAEMGKNLPTTPGSITWKFKNLSGVEVSSLTDTQVANLQSKNAGFYMTVQGAPVTFDGKTASGQFIDVTILCDWLSSRVKEGVFGLFVNSPKIAFTDLDLAKVDNVIRGVLAQGVTNGGIAPDPEFTVFVPRAIDIPANDKANRILPDVTFTAILAGAVHSVQVNGTLAL